LIKAVLNSVGTWASLELDAAALDDVELVVCFEDELPELLELELPQAVKDNPINIIAPIVNIFFILVPPMVIYFLLSTPMRRYLSLTCLQQAGDFFIYAEYILK
jgi:hypothetical protein